MGLPCFDRMWMFVRLFASITLLVCVSILGALAVADEPTQAPSAVPSVLFNGAAVVAPVQIDSCRLEYVVGGGAGLVGLLGALSKSTGPLIIKFTNESDKKIVVVRFAVDVSGQQASVRDVGTFSPGVTINHYFKDFAGKTQFVFSRQPQPTCHLSFAKFADGALWGAATDQTGVEDISTAPPVPKASESPLPSSMPPP